MNLTDRLLSLCYWNGNGKEEIYTLGTNINRGEAPFSCLGRKTNPGWCASSDLLYGCANHWLANRPQTGTLILSKDWDRELTLKAVVSASTEQESHKMLCGKRIPWSIKLGKCFLYSPHYHLKSPEKSYGKLPCWTLFNPILSKLSWPWKVFFFFFF